MSRRPNKSKLNLAIRRAQKIAAARRAADMAWTVINDPTSDFTTMQSQDRSKRRVVQKARPAGAANMWTVIHDDDARICSVCAGSILREELYTNKGKHYHKTCPPQIFIDPNNGRADLQPARRYEGALERFANIDFGAQRTFPWSSQINPFLGAVDFSAEDTTSNTLAPSLSQFSMDTDRPVAPTSYVGAGSRLRASSLRHVPRNFGNPNQPNPFAYRSPSPKRKVHASRNGPPSPPRRAPASPRRTPSTPPRAQDDDGDDYMY